MTEDIHCKTMRTLEMNDDADIVISDDYANDTRSSIYIPQNRFMKKNKNFLYITGGSLMLLLLVINLLVISFKKSPTCVHVVEHKNVQSISQSLSNETSSAPTSISTTSQSTNTKPRPNIIQPIRLSHALIMTSGRNLWAIDSSSLSNQLLLRQMKRNIIAYDVNVNESILWIERNISVVSHLNNSFGIPFSAKWEPQAVAVDYVTDKLYVIDKQAGILHVIDLQNNHTGIVLSDLEDPYDIVLDPLSGFMFIVELDYSILRCEMDGTSLIEIVKNKRISSIAINRQLKKIYWITDFKTIETANYDDVQHFIIHEAYTGNITSLVFHDNQLFWLSTSATSDKTIVYSCKANGVHCNDLLEHTLPFSTQNIRVAPEAINNTRENPCAINNGDCEQLCLLNTNSYTCGCKIGFQLNRNMKTCVSITKFLLYPDGQYFRGRILGNLKQSFSDAFSPTRFFILSLEKKDTIDFDRGWDFHEVYFSDDLCIYRLNLTDGNQTKVYHISDFKNYHIKNLLVDRRSDNFYFGKISNYGGDRSIVIIAIKEGRILQKTFTFIENNGPFFMALHSEYLFCSFLNSHRYDRPDRIAFGNGKTWESQEFNGLLNILSIDYVENHLYFSHDGMIYYTTIKHSQRPFVNLENFYIELPINLIDITTFFVHQKWLYIGNITNIWRFDKKTGSDKTLIISSHRRNLNLKISGAQISDLNLLKNDKNSACAIDNGGCEQFCFARNSVNCSCRDNMIVSEDTHCI